MELIEFQLPFDDLDPVAKDVCDGLLSLQKARAVYGVVVNPETWKWIRLKRIDFGQFGIQRESLENTG